MADPAGTGLPQRPLLTGGEQLRENVERTLGGGPKYHPRTFEEAQQILLPQVRNLQQEVAETPSELRGARVILEASVLPNYLANSYFPAELFRQADLVPVGTRSTTAPYETARHAPEQRATKAYLLAGDERSVNRVAGLLRGEGTAGAPAAAIRESLRQLHLVHLPHTDEVLRAQPADAEGELITWEAVLHPAISANGYPTESERARVLEKWAHWVAELGGEVSERYQRTIKGMTFMPVRLPSDAGPQAVRFNPLRALRPMPQIRPITASPLRIAPATGQPPLAAPGRRPQSDVRIAIFDGGADDSAPHLAPFVQTIDLSPEPAEDAAVDHGTMVTGAALYGPMDAGQQLSTPEIGIDHYRVVPAPRSEQWDVDLFWILDRIEETLAQRAYPVVNLSLGPALSVDEDDEPHAWTARLDELALTHGTLFISAVGNNGELDAASGQNRIQVPADMVNGVGVGSCDCRGPQSPFQRADYSAVGPGRPGARIQPLGVAFGGVTANAFQGLARGGVFSQSQGTSFATPVATHGLAALAALLGAGAVTPDLLRAFAIHYAEPHAEGQTEQLGFGRLPERYDAHLDCALNEITVLYQDSITRGQTITLPFPLPADVVAGRTLNLRWTLAFTAPTDPTDAVDYAQCGLEVTFRPHARRYSFRDPDTGKSVELDSERDYQEVARQLRAGAIPSTLPVSRSSTRVQNEALQREEGKWETALHFTKRMRAASLFRPQLTVGYLAREGGMLIAAPPLSFSMLLSITAPQDVTLYNAVRQHFPVLTPLSIQLPLRAHVQA
jgi:hypothetical protein